MISLLPYPCRVVASGLQLPWELQVPPPAWDEFLQPRLASLASQGVVVQVRAFTPSGHREGLEWAFNQEGYALATKAGGWLLASSSWEGALYGLVSLGQLVRNPAALPAGTWHLVDAPRFAWRGIMIDSARHFTDFAWLMALLDQMAEIKLNVLHWHLADDQGWRFAVPGWPGLVDHGAWRSHSEPDGRDVPGLPRDAQGRYGGCYSDSQIRELVEKARRLNILVVPEIDIPGHSGAALSAYPAELGCEGEKAPVLSEPPVVWGVLPHVLCPGKDGSLEFVRAVFARLAELFPSTYLHLGGDEVLDIGSWEHCPRCKQRVRDLGLAKVRDLEGWFVHQCQQIIRDLGRIPLAWDDVIAQTLPWTGRPASPQPAAHDATVPVPGSGRHPAERALADRGNPRQLYHFWSNREHLKLGLESGEQFVFSPSTHVYLDMTYGQPEPKRWAGYIPVQKSYETEPAGFGMPDSAALGIEAPLWTEHLPRNEDLDRLVWPRLLCVAEAAWTVQGQRDWNRFRPAARHFLDWLGRQGVRWYRSPELEP